MKRCFVTVVPAVVPKPRSCSVGWPLCEPTSSSTCAGNQASTHPSGIHAPIMVQRSYHSRCLSVLSISIFVLYTLSIRAAGARHDSTAAISSHPGPRVGPVLVTGATGRTGSLVFKALRDLHIPVRALVRNATKAKEVLDCDACDEDEGIYVGDITEPASLKQPMGGIESLVILTSSFPLKYPNGTWYFDEGAYPKDIDWIGSNNQVKAALHAGVQHVLLVSSMGTTEPDSFLDKLADGHVMWYKLNGEADLMASGLPFTIIKPGGLLSTEGGKSLLVVGHDDELKHARVTREDLAAVLVAAVQNPKLSSYLRFDLSSDDSKSATGDFAALFREARRWGRD